MRVKAKAVVHPYIARPDTMTILETSRLHWVRVFFSGRDILFGSPEEATDETEEATDETSTIVDLDSVLVRLPDGGYLVVVTATAKVPAGTYEWYYYPPSEQEARAIDPGRLTLERGRTGTVVGDPRCGTWNVPGEACDYIDPGGLARLLGVADEGVTADSFVEDGAGGDKVCVIKKAQEPIAVLSIATNPYKEGAHHHPPYEPTCEEHAEDRGTDGDVAILDCGHGSITSLVLQQTPSGSLPADSIDGPGAGAQSPAQIRIWVDAFHENGADKAAIKAAILSRQAEELIRRTGEKVADASQICCRYATRPEPSR